MNLTIMICRHKIIPINRQILFYKYTHDLLTILILIFGILSCSPHKEKEIEIPQLELEKNGGLYLPDGFTAIPVVNKLKGEARHIAVNDNGDIYVKLNHPHDQGGNAVLRDTDGNGSADSIIYFGNYKYYGNFGTGMRINKGYLYYSSQITVFRQKLIPGQMLPDPRVEIIVTEDNEKKSREHIAKPLAFDDEGHIYVPFGAPSNACMEDKRTPGSPGLDPCPQLENFGGIWRFDVNKQNQLQKDGIQYATGIRSLVCLDWNTSDKNLFAVMHGRDDLLRLFPEIYTPWQSAMLPSEEFIKITEGSDFGWPYCYFDQMTSTKVLAPEYGGDGIAIGRCNVFEDPILGFPGHWAPNDLLFYTGDQFPERYKNGAFVAFHGSTIRAPYPQSGYFIGFVPFKNGLPSGDVEIFADGFARVDTIRKVSDAVFRPMGLAVGPKGELYIGESEKGAIWKVMFTGDKNSFGIHHLSKMKEREQLPHFKTPHEEADHLQLNHSPAARVYNMYCTVCHQPDGRGDRARFPPLAKTKWVNGDKDQLIDIILNGMEGDIEVRKRTYSNVMPRHDFLSDKDVADVLTFIRSNFGNQSSAISEEEVNKVRKKSKLLKRSNISN